MFHPRVCRTGNFATGTTSTTGGGGVGASGTRVTISRVRMCMRRSVLARLSKWAPITLFPCFLNHAVPAPGQLPSCI